jgi:hypothetical protein
MTVLRVIELRGQGIRTFWNIEHEITNFSHLFPTPHNREVPHPVIHETPQTIANKSGMAHKSAKTERLSDEASLLKMRHGVNKFKLTALSDFWTERFKMPFLERIHPPKQMATTSTVDSCCQFRSVIGDTIVGFKRAVKGRSFILDCNDWEWETWRVLCRCSGTMMLC